MLSSSQVCPGWSTWKIFWQIGSRWIKYVENLFFFLKRPWKIFPDCHNDQHPFKTYNSILLPGDLKKKALYFENIQNTCPKIHCIRSKCCHSHPIAKMWNLNYNFGWQDDIVLWLWYWIPYTGVLHSKPLAGSNVDSTLHPS